MALNPSVPIVSCQTYQDLRDAVASSAESVLHHFYHTKVANMIGSYVIINPCVGRWLSVHLHESTI